MSGKVYTPDELAQVLAAHKKWRANDGGQRADLRGAYLGGADLRGANLKGANLEGCTGVRDTMAGRTHGTKGE